MCLAGLAAEYSRTLRQQIQDLPPLLLVLTPQEGIAETRVALIST